MSTLSYAVADSATMLRRQLRHMWRYASMTLLLIGMPIVFLLLFVYVFGGTLGAGLGGPDGGRAEYLEFVTPGILLMQFDGNFVIYDAWDGAVWSSSTHNHPGAYLAVQNDGDVVIFNQDGVPIWRTGTAS